MIILLPPPTALRLLLEPLALRALARAPVFIALRINTGVWSGLMGSISLISYRYVFIAKEYRRGFKDEKK